MAFSGYPDALQALTEMRRLVRRRGRIVLINVNYPADDGWIGTLLTNLAKRTSAPHRHTRVPTL
jgi:ubiquinone/menaquinone biosynthesis C-methylase UbiE